ncbi:hypothetical protein DSO57_1013714 [Entomophthora muscae]|uniref:Uncharacterized protein n=1 Tax=Entomophthora muscae TaxID=34485 RepID=A0ACC2UEX1_9FUNG|nr:hypothetical protein DSO57_1013714 [Entomophthora muscae]
MRFSIILSFSLGTALCRPAAGGMPGFFPDLFLGHHDGAGSKLSAKDRLYVQEQLEDPFKFKALLLEDTVAFDIDHLSIPEAEVEKYLVEDAHRNKESSNLAFAKLVAARTELPTPIQARARITAIIDELAQAENLDQKLLESARTLFKSNPNLPSNLNTMVMHLGGPFDDSLIKLTSTLFSVANQHSPAVSTKVQALVNQVQAEFKILPEDTFRRVQESYTAVL